MGTIRREGPEQQGTLRDFTSGIIRPKRKIKIKSGLLGNLEENPSEIPCRVGKTARNASDRVQITGSNR